MTAYVTIEPCRRLKNIFSNLSSFYIIDVDTIIASSGIDITKKCNKFLVNSELERLIQAGIKSRRYSGFIYINSKLNSDVISALKEMVLETENTTVDSFVLLDDCDVPKLRDYYMLFEEVIFFPTIRKAKILECTPRNIPKMQ